MSNKIEHAREFIIQRSTTIGANTIKGSRDVINWRVLYTMCDLIYHEWHKLCTKLKVYKICIQGVPE